MIESLLPEEISFCLAFDRSREDFQYSKVAMTDEIALKWSTHPIKRSTKVSVLVILSLFMVWSLVYLTTFSLLLTILSVVIMLGSLSSFFLPTYYELDGKKIKVKFFFNTKEKEWSMFRSFYVDKNGVLLSPFERPSRLENFRGLYVRFNQNKEEVVDFVRTKIAG
jgi:hypothetical protein